MTSRWHRHVLAVLSFSSIIVFFLYFTLAGLHSFFTLDDVINLEHLHGYPDIPIYRIALDVLNPFTSAYRPFGGLFYRLMYSASGFHPAPFRYVCFILLLVNMALAFRLFRHLSGSIEAALLGLPAVSYHVEMSELYFNTGTIYDLLCYACVVAALALYIERGQRNVQWSVRSISYLLLLNLLAIQAKEIGCMIPVGMLLYEVCYRGAFIRRSAGELMPLFLTGILTSAMLLHRLLTPNELSGNPLYRPRLSLDFYLHSCARYHGLLFCSPDLFSVPALLTTWGAMALVACLFRSRSMAFGLSFWIIGLAPVALIPGRAAFVLYLPMIGLGLYFGVLAVRVRAALVRTPRFRLASQAALFGLTMAGLAAAHTTARNAVLPAVLRADRDNREILSQLHKLHPVLKAGARVLFLDDPFPRDSWFLFFSLRLMYKDQGIFVDRVKNRARSRLYNYVFSYSGGRLSELPLPPCPLDATYSAEPMDDSSPRVCWHGPWAPGEFPKAYSGTLTFTNEKDATAIVVFEGSSLAYVYTKAFNRGIAEVAIDGAVRATIDQYAPVVEWQARTEFTGLKPGKHTVEVRVLHRRNRAATDSYVDIDALIPGTPELAR